MRSLEIPTQRIFNDLIKQNQKLDDSVQCPDPSVQSVVSNVQRSKSTVQRRKSTVQGPASSVQHPACRVQRLEFSVQIPTYRVQSPTLASRVQEFRYAQYLLERLSSPRANFSLFEYLCFSFLLIFRFILIQYTRVKTEKQLYYHKD